MKKKFLAAAIGAMLVAGSASAVTKSGDEVGDLLIAPAYFIGGGLSTDIKVINTSSTQSVVAKVVFRHPVTSAETLDFLIYLSPSDVWTGNVSCATADANGNCSKSVVTSFDDSMQLDGSAAFGTKTVPATVVSEVTSNGRVALPNQGYFEVVMSSAFDISPFRPGVAKTAILAAHVASPDLVAVGSTPNVLTGSVTVNAGAAGKATLPMVALEDYNNNTKTIIGRLSGLDDPNSRTPVRDVEDALWVNNLAIPYEVGAGKASLAVFTFPTKLTYAGNGAVTTVKNGQFPFQTTTCISADVYDNFENTLVGASFNVSPLPQSVSTCLTEFQWLQFGTNIGTSDFTEGWARIRFNNPTNAAAQVVVPTDSENTGRSGVPALVTYIVKTPTSFTWAYAGASR
jgi:hypothetical protein